LSFILIYWDLPQPVAHKKTAGVATGSFISSRRVRQITLQLQPLLHQPRLDADGPGDARVLALHPNQGSGLPKHQALAAG
jgi:hypothetical protein